MYSFIGRYALLFKTSLVKKEEVKVKEKALEVIEFLNLKHLSNELSFLVRIQYQHPLRLRNQ